MTIELQDRGLLHYFKPSQRLIQGFNIEHSQYQHIGDKFRKLVERATVKSEDMLHEEIMIVNTSSSDPEKRVEQHLERDLFQDEINQDFLLLAGSKKRIVWKP